MYLSKTNGKRNRLAMLLLAVVCFFSCLLLGFSFVGTAEVAEPVVYTFDTKQTINRFASWNATRTLQNGYLHLAVKTNSNEDGFQFDDTLPQSEYIDMSKYTHVKFRLKRENCENARFQFYVQDQNSSGTSGMISRDFVIGSQFDGKWITVTLDLTVQDTTSVAGWVYDEETGETTTFVNRSAGKNMQSIVSKYVRLNVGRLVTKNARSAWVEYLGFFSSKESADSYNGIADQRLQTAETVLRENALVLSYGEGKTEELANSFVINAVEGLAGVGGEVFGTTYVAPTATTDGELRFNIDLVSAGKHCTMFNLKAKIERQPAPVEIRFNNQEIIKKLETSDTKFTLQDGVMNMLKISPESQDGFYIEFRTPGVTEAFKQQDYPYIKIRLNPKTAGGKYEIYYDKDGAGMYTGSRSYLTNWDTDAWLEIIIDMTKSEGAIEIYNTETGEVTYQSVYNDSNWTTGHNVASFSGVSSHFRFNFGRRENLYRETELEYIAFFPTIETARGYDSAWERVKANVEGYLTDTISSVKYEKSNTQALAEAYVRKLAQGYVGDICSVSLTDVAYVAPTETADGSISYGVKLANMQTGETFQASSLQLRLRKAGSFSDVALAFRSVNPMFASVGYTNYATEELAYESALKLLQKSLSSHLTCEELTNCVYTPATATAQGTFEFSAVIKADDDGEPLQKTVDGYVLTIDKIPADGVVTVFDEAKIQSVDTYSNARKSVVNGRLRVDVVEPTLEDQFSIGYETENYRLEDYPYIKIRYKKDGYGATGYDTVNGGRSIIYIFNGSQMVYNCTFFLGEQAEMNVEMFAIIDVRNKLISLYNMETSKCVSTATLFATEGAYEGNATSVMFNLARWTQRERWMELDYIGAFSSEAAALRYNDDTVMPSLALSGGDYVATANDLQSAPKTLEAFVKADAVATDGGLIVGNAGFALYVTANGEFALKHGDAVTVTTGANAFSGKWVHVAATIDGGVKIYVNGELKGEGALGATASATTKLYVGGCALNEMNLTGRVADVRIWNEVRTQSEIAENRYVLTGKTPAERWLFDKAKNNAYANASKADNVATYFDEYGRLYHEFLGQDCLTSAKGFAQIVQTVETWIASSANKQATLLDNGAIRLAVTASGELAVTFGDVTKTTTNANLYGGQWKRLTVVRNVSEGTLAVYVNGVSVGEWSGLTFATSGEDGAFTFGANADKTDYYIGRMGETRFWSVALSGAEATERKDAYANGDETGLLASWKLDYSYALIYPDVVDEANGATLQSDGWYRTNMGDFDHTIVIFPDTQDSMLLNHKLNDLATDYIVENAEDLNVELVVHVGDITQNNTEMEMEWSNDAFAKLKDVAPFAPVIGNHDYPDLSGRGSAIRDGSVFNENWHEYITSQAQYGGAFEEGKSDNYYLLYSDGSNDYVVLAVEFGPRDEVLEWANIILKRYADRKAILVTHSGPSAKGVMSGDNSDTAKGDASTYTMKDSTTINEVFDIWKKVIMQNENLVTVISGHVQAVRVETNFGDKYDNEMPFVVCDTSGMPSFPGGLGLIGLLRYNDDGTAAYYLYSASENAYYKTQYYFTLTLKY